MPMRPRHPSLSAVFLIALLSCSKCATADLVADLDHALGRGQIGETHYTARVIDPATGKQLYAVDCDTPCMPASNGKIAVGAATLDSLGASAIFKTYLALDGQDLW